MADDSIQLAEDLAVEEGREELNPEPTAAEDPLIYAMDDGITSAIPISNESAEWMQSWFSQEQDAFMICGDTSADMVCYDSSFDNSGALCSTTTTSILPLIDSGASRNVAGVLWLRKFLDLSDNDALPSLTTTARVFRFGNSMRYPSMGSITVQVQIEGYEESHMKTRVINVNVDIIDLSLPFLLSGRSLSLLKATIDFGSRKMIIDNKFSFNLIPTLGGHLSFRWKRAPAETLIDSPTQDTYANIDEQVPMSIDQTKKLHVQLGHADTATILRVCRIAGKPLSEEVASRVVQNCI